MQRKTYCLKCGLELKEKFAEECSCGSKNFVYGSGIKSNGKGIACDCENDKFDFVSHVNMGNIHSYTYRCAKCGNSIGVEKWVESFY